MNDYTTLVLIPECRDCGDVDVVLLEGTQKPTRRCETCQHMHDDEKRAEAREIVNRALDVAIMRAGDEVSAKCYCGAELTFSVGYEGKGSSCHCARCEKRAGRDDNVHFVYGYGVTDADALANWKQAMEAM